MKIEDVIIGQKLIDSTASTCKTKNKNINATDGKIYEIGNKSYDGTICVVTNKTQNSVEVLLNKKCFVAKVDFHYILNEGANEEEKVAKIDEIQTNGVNCKQWFTMENFTKRFKTV